MTDLTPLNRTPEAGGSRDCPSCARPDVVRPDDTVIPHDVLGLASPCDEPSVDRPTITIDPAKRFGRPHIRGISTQAIAGLVISGDGVDAAMDDFDLTRHEVLLACWHEGLQGEYQREWGEWANAVHSPLGGWEPLDVDALPDPPERQSTT